MSEKENNLEIDSANPHKALLEPDSTINKRDSSLQALIAQEQNSAYRQLKEELGREPDQKEIDEWLNAHTESY